MNKILKNKKILTQVLIIVAIVLLAAISLQSGFAATTHNINNTTSGGINGTLATVAHGDTIELDEGNYTGNNNTNITINKNITIQGKTKDKVILDAQKLSRIFIVNNNLNVTFINITFLNGEFLGEGGAIYSNFINTTIALINCSFINNSAINTSTGNGNGGGIFILGNLSINNSNFVENTAGNMGGTIYSRGNLSIKDSIFTNNIAGNQGGAIYVENNCSIIIKDSIFANNIAGRVGGALYHRLDGSLIIINSTIINNTAGFDGGGIYIRSNTIIKNSTISNNTAFNNGGGILIYTAISVITNNSLNSNNCINVTIINSNISNNFASNDGGGICNIEANLTIIDTNIVDNSAGGDGGAVSSSTADGGSGDSNVNIYNSTMNNNSAGNNGGGVSSSTGVGSDGDSTVNIDDSTIDDNTAGNEGGAISSNTGENSTGNSTVNVNDSDLGNNIGGNGGDTISSTTGNGSTGDSTVNVGGDSTITNNNPNRDDEGLSLSTGDNSTGESNINIDPSVTIKRLSASSTIVAPNATVGKSITIRGVAKDQNGKPLANIKLTVTIDGKIYTVTTNSAGEWSLTYIPTKIANIQVTVALNQNNVYYAFSKTASFRAIQTVTLTISAPTINQGKKTNIKVTLKDANGNILKNKKITITINKKTYTTTTNNNGISTFKIANLKGGKYTVIANFAGDNDYKSLTVSGIQKVNSKVNLGILSIKKIKSSNKKNPKYKITIINKGSLKSKATVLSIFHIRNGIKIKTKYFKVKAIGAGKKISIIVDYFPNKAKHRYCIAHYTLDPKNKNKEILLANNKKSIRLKH